MPFQLIETKLHAPEPRRFLVERPRFKGLLGRGAEAALTLVSAPAGFGKTTALATWLASPDRDGRAVAWLSLDPRDNDPVTYWRYLISALERGLPGIGARALPLLQPPVPPIESVLSILLNDLHAAGELVLVLDDYHVIESHEIQEGMDFLIQHLPPQTHLVIVGRADPALPLARLRGRGALTEIRASDLRFTRDEAAEYLNGSMGLALTDRNIEALDERTEGWIAALQLAALSLQGRVDPTGFITGFTGDDRYIVDYLTEEVLRGLSVEVRDFLLQTSILERLSGPLCDAVTGRDGGRAALAGLDRANLFLAPLDAHHSWYRYHQLFADVLRARLLEEHPEDVPELHRRAGIWYEQNGDRPQAIHHAVAARDFERVADLVELSVQAMRRTRGEASLLGWFKLLPRELFSTRPVLSVGFAGALLAVGDVDAVEERLREAERWLDPASRVHEGTLSAAARMRVMDQEEFQRLPAVIDLYRAALSLARGDPSGTVILAGRALGAFPPEEHLGRAAASGLLGMAAWAGGDLDTGIRAYETCVVGLRRAGHIADTFGCTIALTDLRLAQGRLGLALSTCRQAVERGTGPDGALLRGTADMHVAMSAIHLERNDLPAATRELRRSRELGEHLGLPQNPYRWRVAMARIRVAEGDPDGALELLEDAERLYVSDFFPPVRPISALRARILANGGRLGEAFSWASEQGISADDESGYLHEFEHLTLAMLLLARHAADGMPGGLDDSIRLLERLLQAAEAGQRPGSIIEILALLALARRAQGDTPAALASLQRALSMAEPEGYVRVFADGGAPMASLLGMAAKQDGARDYARMLQTAARKGMKAATGQKGLVEPLSARELEVLRLLGTDLDGPGIARELMVSLNTLRSHTSHIYTKLGVTSRRAALRRAKDLGLSPGNG